MLEHDTMSGPPSVGDEPPRKRVRKGTRSCWECKAPSISHVLQCPSICVAFVQLMNNCWSIILTPSEGKRRKVRCQLSSEDVPVCAGCLSRGTTCLGQEYPEEREPSNNSNQVGERLGRMEALLETLVAKISAYEEEEEAQKMMTPESIGNDVLTPFATSGSDPSSNTPIIQIFDSPIVSHQLEVSVGDLRLATYCVRLTNVP